MTTSVPIKVSIVEDDNTIRETLRSLFLFEEGMQAFTVHSTAEDALMRLGETCPDVVIMDINLPGASGIEAVRALSERHPAAQFLMYSMHDDDQRVFDALKAGANGYLLKSAKPSEILAAIRDLVQGGSPMSAPIARRVVAQMRPARPGASIADAGLTEREQEVLRLLSEGLLYKEIGDRVGISESAVKQHIHRMYGKMHVQNRTEAVNKFFGR